MQVKAVLVRIIAVVPCCSLPESRIESRPSKSTKQACSDPQRSAVVRCRRCRCCTSGTARQPLTCHECLRGPCYSGKRTCCCSEILRALAAKGKPFGGCRTLAGSHQLSEVFLICDCSRANWLHECSTTRLAESLSVSRRLLELKPSSEVAEDGLQRLEKRLGDTSQAHQLQGHSDTILSILSLKDFFWNQNDSNTKLQVWDCCLNAACMGQLHP